MELLPCILFILVPLCGGQLIVNMKNKGNEILRESIQGNTSDDTVILEFQKSDGTLVTQFVDFKNEVQIFRSVVLGEEELGQTTPQTMCFVTRFIKNEFITSDAMSKLRQKNPSAIRSPEDDKGVEMFTLDVQINYDKSHVFSPYVAKFCEDAKSSTYGRDADLKVLSRTVNKDYNVLLGATKRSPLDKVPSCSMITVNSQSCLCRYEICVGWYPCGLKFCHGKDAAGKTVSYRCGIKTCKKCRIFDYYVKQKMECLWDQPE